MRVEHTALEGVLVIEPGVHGDSRGFLLESWRSGPYAGLGLPAQMVQSNFSRSAHGVLRGLHYQYPQPQGKLVSVLEGSIYDVAVDIRFGSPQFASGDDQTCPESRRCSGNLSSIRCISALSDCLRKPIRSS